MEKRKAAAVLDNVILIAGIWMLSYLWTRYYVMNLLVALVAATGIALCVVMLINLRRKKNKLTRKQQKRIDNTMNQFLYGGKDFSLDFFHTALNKKLDAEKKEGFILAEQTAVFPKFSLGQLNLQQIIDCYISAKKTGARRILILTLSGCDKLAKQNLGNLPDIKTDVFDRNKCYDFLGWLGLFPEIKIEIKPEKNSLKNILLGALSPAKAKHYLIISIVLMISSYFVTYSIYYIIIASATLALALFSRFDIIKRLAKRDSSPKKQ